MPTPRDQLIADWRKRLAAISEAPEEATSRAAWLARLRKRLYRFLLSLYGEGDWNAPAEPNESGGRRYPDSTATTAEGLSLDLAGKPAKNPAAIRAVLDSVAGAAEATPIAGPLAAGIDREDWVVVASISRGLNPELVTATLLAKGIVSRFIVRARDTTVEVRGYHEAAAVELIAAQYSRLLIRPGAAPLGTSQHAAMATGGFPWPLLFLGLGVGPVVGFLVLLLQGLAQPSSVDQPTAVQFLWLVAYIWLGSFAVGGMVYLLLGLRQKSAIRSGRASDRK